MPSLKQLFFRAPWKGIAPAILFIFVMVVLWYILGHSLLSLESIQYYGEKFKTYATDHRAESLAIFFVFYVCTMCLLIPAIGVLDLLAGFLFGTWCGGTIVLIGDAVGGSIVFLVARSTLGRRLRERAGPFYEAAHKEMQQGAVSYLLFMRLTPGVPFAVANIIPALLHVRWRIHLLTTLIGLAPLSFIMANLGQALGELRSMEDLFSLKLFFSFSLLGVLALIPLVLKKIKARRTRKT
jgi:uncharacterized membrane protein YdjX (TVP38/TMEM64 family)